MKRIPSALLFGSLVLLAGCSVPLDGAPADKDKDKGKTVLARPLKFQPKDATIAFTIGGKNELTTMTDAAAVEKLVGKDNAKGLVDQVDFTKEMIVLVSWIATGPPEGKLAQELIVGDKKRLNFFVQGPPDAKVRGQRARLGADFFAVPRDVKVSFDPKERN